MAVKWNFASKFDFSNKTFAKIYKFYVIETPIDGVSARGKSFKSRGINMTSLNAAIKRETPFMKERWFDEKVTVIENKCKSEGIYNDAGKFEEIAIHSVNNKLCTGKTDSLFYTIRCAFAHGSFSTHTHNKTNYYLLENKDGGKIKGRLIVKESTLLKWIEIVESAPKPVPRKKTKRKQIHSDIYFEES